MNWDFTAVSAVVIVVLAAASLVDLHRIEVGAVTVYTTPALRDLLEKSVFPAWRTQEGQRAVPVYVAAGEQYARLRMSGTRPEADVFLHASPLFLQKGFDEGYMVPFQVQGAEDLDPTYRSRTNTSEGNAWYTVAWSPMVQVYSPKLGDRPDFANANLRYGLAHPTLSNNGVYTTLFLEAVSPAAGQHARSRTVVQPVNARTNIIGVADGSFDLTLGYEAVARFFQAQGANITFSAPIVEGKEISTPVLFSAAIIKGGNEEASRSLIEFLLSQETQRMLPNYHLRSVFNITQPPSDLPEDLAMVQFDWEDWRSIEEVLPTYEVVRHA